jgi:UDP-3-O-[3-hydroxymyristoyl] N-acetylglucosamine deacetylase
MNQRTIKNIVEVVGIGLHTGEPIRVRLEPMPIDTGIVFYRDDIALNIPLTPTSVINTQMATVIGDSRGSISTIEHFLSAIYAYAIDNIRIIVNGAEMPVMDGSAISFCLLLDEAKITVQDAPKKIIKIKKEITIKDKDKFVSLKPSSRAYFNFEIDFSHRAIGKQKYKLDFSNENFVNEIARARTFGFVKDIQYLQSQNLALGASLNNAIGLDDNKIINPEGLRFDNEFVRHKILDAMGDMMVIGHNILGGYNSFAGSHHLNSLLTKKLLSCSDNYEIVAINRLESRVFEKSFARL